MKQYHNIRNAVQLAPVWVAVYVSNVFLARIDWNNKTAVRDFAELADSQLRAGNSVETRPVV